MARRTDVIPQRTTRARVVALLIFATAAAPMALRRAQRIEPIEVVLASAAVTDDEPGVIVIVSADCDHCRERLNALEAADGDAQGADLRRIAVLRESDLGAAAFRERRSRWDTLVVPDHVWWPLVGERPPTEIALPYQRDPLAATRTSPRSPW